MRLMIVLSRLFLAVITINLGFIVRQHTNKNRCREADTLYSGVGQARSLDELDFLPY
jgi:hypothetical protein